MVFNKTNFVNIRLNKNKYFKIGYINLYDLYIQNLFEVNQFLYKILIIFFTQDIKNESIIIKTSMIYSSIKKMMRKSIIPKKRFHKLNK